MKKTYFLIALTFLIGCGPGTSDEPTEMDEIDIPDDGSETPIEINKEVVNEEGLQLDKISLPAGFKIDVFGRVKNARSLALSPSGTLFIGNRGNKGVYALKDFNGDMKADSVYTIVDPSEGMSLPNGVAFKDGTLYVADISTLWRFPDIENNLNSPTKEMVFDDLPSERHHGWKYIAFGPDDKLYVPVGAPCNTCESLEDERFATIMRMDSDGSNREIVARGVRNTVGFTWHPQTNELWFTDNGRDDIAGRGDPVTDDSPPCELNRLSTVGQHFGYPYCHAGTILDPGTNDDQTAFETNPTCDGYQAPAQNLGAHVAPLGVKFGTSSNFPADYLGKIFIAEHGSWNRTKKIGYRVQLVTESEGTGQSYETFASGWLEGEEYWGRPVDLIWASDGSMLLSDDFSGTVYRIWHDDTE